MKNLFKRVMKFRKRFGLLLISVLALSISNVVAFANTTDIDNNEETQSSESIIINDSATIHTVTLQRINPVKENDEYGWMLKSEPGQLGYSLNALGLGNPNPNLFGNDTTMLFPEDGIDLERIFNKLDVDNNVLLENSTPLVITYTQEDIGDYDTEPITNVEGEDDIISFRATGSFSKTLKSNQNSETSAQKKDDDEQMAYLTITKLAPTEFQYFHGIYARVKDNSDNKTMTPWANFTSKGSYNLYYYSFAVGEAGTKYYLELSNGNDRAIDVAGRWTP